ncbi:MAG: chemotaxis protein CheA [Planctomyces sp.]|nr:chemotaxis protein CheA [Planctomyces sp.]
MSSFADPELMQDFLTESGELLEQLDQDLVLLESTPNEPELLNRVFRALHTIKGSASFLALANLVEVAHAAETALNAARNGVFVPDRRAMDLLLGAVDTIKRQFEDIRAERDLARPDAALCAALSALGEAGPAHESGPGHAGSGAPQAPAQSAGSPSDQPPAPIDDSPAHAARPAPLAEPAPERPLELGSGKAELFDFLLTDARQALDAIGPMIDSLGRAGAVGVPTPLIEQAEALAKSVEFFGLTDMAALARALAALEHAPRRLTAAVTDAAAGVLGELRAHASALSARRVRLAKAEPYTAALAAAAADAHDSLIRLDDPKAAPQEPPAPAPAGAAPAGAAPAAAEPEPEAAKAASASGPTPAGGSGDQTIRVEVGRLEALLNLVGELVLQKNRMGALTRQLGSSSGVTQDLRETFTQTSGALDRVTSDLQLAVMKTRMQPLEKLFGKYPRLVRDLARKLGKDIRLVIEGAQTEVDKSVIEELGDPLVHLMRNACDHGLESPERRAAAGKPAQGTIVLRAQHESSYVSISIADDGRGLDRDRIRAKAIEKGLYTPEQLGQMSDQDVDRIIFAAGFSTAEKISDVSGRGVGMDVVRANIEQLKGTIDLGSAPGKGCTVTIRIPLTVAILSAMMVGVRDQIYAIPLAAVTEIVRPEPAQVQTIRQRRVMRLRDTVLPLVDAHALLARGGAAQPDQGRAAPAEAPFAVVLQHGSRRMGLMVHRLVGQQEVVIKPLDGLGRRSPAISGATIRDDGGVSLIVDPSRLISLAEVSPQD